MITIRRILVPTDFSEFSRQAVKYAREFAVRFEAEVHLLHVVQPAAAHVSYGAPIPQELLHPEQPAVEAMQQLVAEELETDKSVVQQVRTGPPFLEIVRYAAEHDIDLIVMGTHGRAGLAHAIIGSVAERVVRKARCPVLTVRPEGHQFVMP